LTSKPVAQMTVPGSSVDERDRRSGRADRPRSHVDPLSTDRAGAGADERVAATEPTAEPGVDGLAHQFGRGQTLKRSRPSCCGSGACREPIARWTYWLRRARARSESPRWRHRPRARARLGSRRVGGRRCCGADARRRPGPARSRNARRLKRPGGEHDLAGLVRAVVGLDEVAARACLHGPHERVELDGSLEVACILGEVADDLVARPVVVGVSGERPARKAVVAGGGEQRQRVPARAPRRCRSYLCQRWLRSFQSSVQCLCLAV
jgi:hypothetical protein